MLFARIRHDVKRRNNGLLIYPETVPLQNSAKGTGKGEVIPYPDQWEAWTRALNSPESAEWLFTVGSMLFNIEYTDTPKAESVTNGGEVVAYTKQTATHSRLFHYRNYSTPPVGATYENRPWGVHKVVCIRSDTLQIMNPGDALDVYFPLLSKGDLPLWIPNERLEMFPTLPFRAVVLADKLPVRQNPSPASAVIKDVRKGQTITLVEYRPRGSDVWGRLSIGGWALIQGNRTFTTSWAMQTQPPIPPSIT